MGLWLLTPLGFSLLLTLVLEVIFAIMIGVRNPKDILLLCMVNVLTNPAVVIIYYLTAYYDVLNSTLVIIVLEVVAILVEAYYIKIYGKTFRRPLLFAIAANLFSYGVGKIINFIF